MRLKYTSLLLLILVSLAINFPGFPTKAQSIQTSDVEWSPNGEKIAVATNNGIAIYNATNGQLLLNIPVSGEGVSLIKWSPDGNKIAGSEWDTKIHIWNAANGQLLGTLSGFSERPTGLTWNSDGSRLISIGFEYELLIWNSSNYQLVQSYPQGGRDVEISPDNNRLAIALGFGVTLVNLSTGQIMGILQSNQAEVTSVSWSVDGNIVVSAGFDGTIRTWNLVNNQPILVLELGSGIATGGVRWLPGNRIASSGSDGIMRAWNANTGQLLYTSYPIAGVAEWSPNGTQLAITNTDGSIQITNPVFSPTATPTPTTTSTPTPTPTPCSVIILTEYAAIPILESDTQAVAVQSFINNYGILQDGIVSRLVTTQGKYSQKEKNEL